MKSLRQDVSHHLNAEGAARNVGEAHPDGLGFHFRVAVKQAADFSQHEAHMVGLGLRAQPKIRLEKNLVAAAEVLEVDGRHGPVGNRHQRSLLGADAGGTQADIFDHAGTIAEAANIADAEHFVAENGNATEKILDGFLRAEADRQAANAEPGERGAHVEAQVAEHGQNAHHKNHRLEDALAQQHERSCAGVAAGQGAIAHAVQRPSHDVARESMSR